METTIKLILTSFLLLVITTPAISQDTLITQQYEMNGCVPIYSSTRTRVIKTRSELDSLTRRDMSKNRCIKQLKQIDLTKYSILGININSGWCKIPLGLEFTTTKNDASKKYIFTVSYITRIGTCRALSSYYLWVKVPNLPDGYEVEFIVDPVDPEESTP